MPYRPSRRLIISTAIILCLLGAFVLVLPEIVRRMVLSRLEARLTVPVSLDDVDVNLLTGRASIEKLLIGNNTARPILRVPAATIVFSRSALLRGRIDLAAMVLKHPELFVERTGPDNYNIVQALRRPDQTPQDGRNGRGAFRISRLEIQNGEIAVTDRTQQPDYRLTLSSLSLVAGPIATLPQVRATPTTFAARVGIGGGSITLAGSTRPLRKPATLDLKAEISNVKLQAFRAYLPYPGRLNVKNTVLNGEARYVVTHGDGKTGEHYIDADLRTDGAALMSATASQPVLQISALTARDIHVDFLQHQTVVDMLAIQQPHLLVKRDSTGFNFRQLLPVGKTPRSESRSGGGASGNRMSLAIRHVEAKNGAIEFVDQTVNPNARSRFEDVGLMANDMQLLPNFAVAQIEAEGRLQKGSVQVTGAFSDQPFNGRFDIAGAGLPFQPFSGYLDQLLGSANSSGERINGKLQLALAADESGKRGVKISGNLEGQDIGLRFPAQQKPFLLTQRLGVNLKTIRLGSSPLVDIDEIKLTGAKLRVVRDKAGSLNLTRLWAANGRRQPKASKTGTETGPTIRLITVDEGNIAILDRSVSPDYQTELTRVTGKVSELRPKARRALLKLQGVLGGSANLSLSGWFTPFSENANMHLEGTIRSYALPPLNPYATKYVSHRVQRGEITMEVNYTLKEGEVAAAADVLLRQVHVGEKTGNEFHSRIGIPLELAVALLQDINGVIRLHLAMSGDSGPQLNISSLVWNAVRNAIVGAITAPFRLIGKIFTSGGKIGGIQIDPIPFESGTREIPATAAQRLGKLAEILKEKPKLDLKIVGAASRAEIDTLKQKKFWKKIDSMQTANYQEALIRLYREIGGVTQPAAPLAPIAEQSMERFVLAHIEISQAELVQLARDRAETVKEQLVKRGVEPERLAASARENVANEAAVEIEIAS